VRTEGGPWSAVGRKKGADGTLFSSNEIKSFSQVLLQFSINILNTNPNGRISLDRR
jgi:hypothetical protein